MRVSDFDLEQTLECGQCFNFEKTGEKEYIVTAFEKVLHIKQNGSELLFLNSDKKDIEEIWIPYFDLNRDYGKIKKEIVNADRRLAPIVEQYGGIRILNQDFYETLISFIISQQNQIPKIKKAVRTISERYGKNISGEYYSFPDIPALSEISEDEYRNMSLGYRAAYLKDTAQKLKNKEICADDFLDKEAGGQNKHRKACIMADMKRISYNDAKNRLLKLKGVGNKVANCVLLFGLGYREAFPVDTWIRRIMLDMYFEDDDPEKISNTVIEEKGTGIFGEYGGYAQQYLFIYARNRQ